MTNREIDQRALLIAKDAEIERLKEAAKYDAFLREKYRGLITELCDALEPFVFDYDPEGRVRTMLKRAREATR